MNELARISKVRQELERATSVEEVKDIRNLAEAAREYAKQVGLGLEAQNECAEIKIRAERKGGLLLKEMELNKGGRPSQNYSHDVTGFPSLNDIGVGRMQSSRWQLEASLPDDIFEEYITEVKSKPDELTSAGVIRLARKLLQ